MGKWGNIGVIHIEEKIGKSRLIWFDHAQKKKKKKEKVIDAQARKSILIQVNEMRRDRKSPKIRLV